MVQADWLNHRELKIIKGIGKTPGDPYSAEPDPIVVNLMGGMFTLQEWSPQIPPIKSGGVWVESPLSDGRKLLAAAAQNVTEKIDVLISDSSYTGLMVQLSTLNLMVNSCRDYWEGEAQIDPVYLVWWAGCGAGPQYALISNIDISPDYLESPTPSLRVSLAIEREPFWRGIPPGANPKIWAYEVNTSNAQFTYSVASLVSGSDHLITQDIENLHSWSPTAYGLQTTPIQKNYIEITAAQVPGDAPALVELTLEELSGNDRLDNVYIARSTKKFSGTGHDGIARANALNLNAGDGGSLGTVTKTLAGTGEGVISNNSSSAEYMGVRTVTGIDASYVTACRWGTPPTANMIKLDKEFYRGEFAIFARAFNASVVAPVLTDMRMRVVISEGNNANPLLNTVTLQAVNPPIFTPTPAVDNYELSYMGTIKLPFAGRSVVSGLGYGKQLQEQSNSLTIQLQVKVDVATANRTFRAVDLMLVPIDEGIANINMNADTNEEYLVLDNTGYFLRGQSEQIAMKIDTDLAAGYTQGGGVAVELRGSDLMLEPRVNQRIYILRDLLITGSGSGAGMGSRVRARLNIVPRWAGIRDV